MSTYIVYTNAFYTFFSKKKKKNQRSLFDHLELKCGISAYSGTFFASHYLYHPHTPPYWWQTPKSHNVSIWDQRA